MCQYKPDGTVTPYALKIVKQSSISSQDPATPEKTMLVFYKIYATQNQVHFYGERIDVMVLKDGRTFYVDILTARY